MAIVSVVYFSGSGLTAKMADAVARGAASVDGVNTNLFPIVDEDLRRGRYENERALAWLDSSDAIIFGSPTYMGGPPAQFKALPPVGAEGHRALQGAWRAKFDGFHPPRKRFDSSAPKGSRKPAAGRLEHRK